MLSLSAALDKIRGTINPFEDAHSTGPSQPTRHTQTSEGQPHDVEFTLEPRHEPINAQQLPVLIDLFMHDCRLRNLKEKSLINYSDHFAIFLRWFDKYAPEFNYQLTKERFNDFSYWLTTAEASHSGDKVLSSNTQAQTLRRLKQLMRWAHRTGRVDMDISYWIPSKQITARKPRHIDSDVINKLLMAAAATGHIDTRLRNVAMLCMLLSTGARREEIYEIEKRNIRFRSDSSGIVDLGITKKDKPRVIFFDRFSGAILQKYVDGRGDGRIWSLENHSAIYFALVRLCERAGVHRLSPHDCRKYFASYYGNSHHSKEGFSKEFLKMMMGHVPAGVLFENYVFLRSEAAWYYYVSPLTNPSVSATLQLILQLNDC